MHAHVRMVILALLTFVLGACQNDIESGNAEAATKKTERKDAALIIPVEAERPQRGAVSEYFETVTRVEAERRVDVLAEGMGRCLAVNVEEGDTVSKGEVLGQLDAREVEAAIRQTEVQVRQQKTLRDRAKMSSEAGLTPRADYENAQFAYDQSLATFSSQQLQLDNMTIRAPISGILTRRNIQQGMLVSSGTPAFSIVDPDSYLLTINPPESKLQRLSVGQVAKMTVDSIAGAEFTARIRRINPNVESGTVKVTLDIDKEARENLREGAFARVRLVLGTRENALLLPKDALVDENARKYVFLARNAPVDRGAEQSFQRDSRGNEADDPPPEPVEEKETGEQNAADTVAQYIAERVEVQTGLEDSGKVEIVSGISEEDRVITRGQQALKPGSPISLTTEKDQLESNLDMSAEEALAKAQAKRDAGAKTVLFGGGGPGPRRRM